VAAAAVGLVVLTGCLAGLLSTDTGHGQAVVAVTGALGTALSGYVGKLFRTTYQLSVRQMSYYCLQPQITCYLLHAEHLAKDLAGAAED
jgi:hypothetical protein